MTAERRGHAVEDRLHRPPVRLRVVEGSNGHRAQGVDEAEIGLPETVYLRWGKPLADRIGGLLMFALVALPCVVIALCIWTTMGRPILFRQKRVGLGGRVFEMYKFRSMLPDRRREQVALTGPERRRAHKSPDDPRLTPLGRFLRKWSLDELPQFWNVLRGDMSLVGPRPELVEIVDSYQPWQHRRHLLKPGVTGLWQVTARNNGVLMHEATDIDLSYLRQVSPGTDLRILVRTIPAMLGSGF